ncbi:MAG: GldG family protein [Hyphomicrobiaceae bacterium]|nr:GldG family protein [Hyphomicrobiaceae bacterium]
MADETNNPKQTERRASRKSAASYDDKIAIANTYRNVFMFNLFKSNYITRFKCILNSWNLVPAVTNKRTSSWLVVILAGIIVLCANLIISKVLRTSSIDLTEDQLYTVSTNTKKVLSDIKETIDIRVYFTERLGETAPTYRVYLNRIRALLDQYSNISGGMLRLAFIEPEPFSDAEDRALAAGLRQIRLNEAGDQAFFGLVATNSTDQQEIVPFFTPQRERYLEYEITKLIHKLSAPKKQLIGLVSSLPVMGSINSPGIPDQRTQPKSKWVIIEQIEEFFDVKSVDTITNEIDPEVDLLMILQPTNISEETAYAIDQFALKGKPVIVFVDPLPDIALLLQSASTDSLSNSKILRILKSWGVKINTENVAGDIQLARRVQTSGPQSIITEYVTWLSVQGALISEKDVISDGIKIINFSSAGFFEEVDGATTNFQPLMKTTQTAMKIPLSNMIGQPDPVRLLRDYRPGGKQLILAGRVTGKIKTAFPDGRPTLHSESASPPKAGNKEILNQKSKGISNHLKSGNLNAIIIGDTDFLYEDFWLQVGQFLGQRVQQPIAHNASFVLNALENLSGGTALSGLSSRGVSERRFTTVDNIRRVAEQRYRESENQLQSRLDQLRLKLSKVEQRTKNGEFIFNSDDTKSIETFRNEMLVTRKELRDLQHKMRSDIESLEGWLKLINIAIVPLLFSFGGLAFATIHRRKFSRYQQ